MFENVKVLVAGGMRFIGINLIQLPPQKRLSKITPTNADTRSKSLIISSGNWQPHAATQERSIYNIKGMQGGDPQYG